MIWFTRLLPLIIMAFTAILGIFLWRNLDLKYRIVTYICCFNFISDFIGNILGFYNINNHFIYNIADFIRTELWLFYFLILFNKHFFNKFILGFVVVFTSIFVVVQFVQPIYILQTISYITGGVFIITSCLLYYIFEFQNDENIVLFKVAPFWLTTGLVIYYAFNIPFLGLLPWLLKHSNNFVIYYFYICVIGSSIILSIFKIKAFLCLKSK